MSANDGILIQQTKSGWEVRHYDADGCYNDLIGTTETLDGAVDMANKWERDEIDDCGFGAEYGMTIKKLTEE